MQAALSGCCPDKNTHIRRKTTCLLLRVYTPDAWLANPVAAAGGGFFADIRTSMSRLPSLSKDQRLSEHSPGFRHQTGTAEVPSCVGWTTTVVSLSGVDNCCHYFNISLFNCREFINVYDLLCIIYVMYIIRVYQFCSSRDP